MPFSPPSLTLCEYALLILAATGCHCCAHTPTHGTSCALSIDNGVPVWMDRQMCALEGHLPGHGPSPSQHWVHHRDGEVLPLPGAEGILLYHLGHRQPLEQLVGQPENQRAHQYWRAWVTLEHRKQGLHPLLPTPSPWRFLFCFFTPLSASPRPQWWPNICVKRWERCPGQRKETQLLLQEMILSFFFFFPPNHCRADFQLMMQSFFFVSRFQRPEPEEVGLEGIPVTAHSNATVFVFTLRLVMLCAAALTPPVCGSRRGSGGEGERGGWCRRCCALKTRETKDQRLRLDFTRRTVALIHRGHRSC